MSFEIIVRPFQTIRVHPLPKGATVLEATEEPEPIVLVFGADAQVKKLNGSVSVSSTSFQEKESKELSRETKERRVENPDDPSQYVIVEDTTKITTESGKQDTYEKQSFEFKDQEAQ